MARRLDQQIPRRLVHPVEQHEVCAGLDVLEPRREARIEMDGADGRALAAVLWTGLALGPRRADAADEVDPGVGRGRQIDRLLAGADAEVCGPLRGSVHGGFLIASHSRCRLRTLAIQGANRRPASLMGIKVSGARAPAALAPAHFKV